MMKAKANHQNKFMKILAMPIRALAKARDFYVKSMNNYADKVHYGAGPGFGSAGYSVPRSFSTNSMRSSSNEDDFRELVRAASTSTLGNRIDLTSAFSGANSSNSSSLQPQKQGTIIRGVPRSASVGMAKIEEDKPCEFDVDDEREKDEPQMNKGKFRMFPRSRSYAVGATKRPIPSAF